MRRSLTPVAGAVLAVLVALSPLACTPTTPDPDPSGLVGRPEPAPDALSTGNLWYHVTVDDEVLDIHTRLYAPPKRTTFFLPGGWAGRDDYDDAVRLAGARTEAGSREMTISRERGEVDVDVGDAEWVEIHYRVELKPRSDFHPQLDRGVLVAFGPTFLVTPAQQVLERTRSIPIEVLLPDDWKVVSTWPRRNRSPSQARPDSTVHGFIASDVRQLRDAFLVAGSTLRTERRGGGRDLVEVAFGPAVEGDTEAFADEVTAIANRFRSLYGAVGPVHAYVRTRTATSERLRGLGRRGGFVIDVPPDAGLSQTTQLLVAHEALHLWNGHLLVPDAEAERSTRWFKEGVTHYLALKALARAGAVDEEFVLRELATAAANYARNPLSMGARGRPADRARFPYDLGVLVALGFDAVISGSGPGLEGWLQELLRGREDRYDERALLVALRQCAPANDRQLSELWRRWVRMSEPIALRELFRGVGLHWLPESGDRPARLMPLDGTRPFYLEMFGMQP